MKGAAFEPPFLLSVEVAPRHARSAGAVDPHHVAQLQFPGVMSLHADPLDRLAVTLVSQEDLLAAVSPVFPPLAQSQDNGKQRFALG